MRDVILTLKTVFGNFHYASIAAIISLATFVISVWLRNFRLIVYYFARKRNLPKKEGIAAAGGLAGGILGIGCASCGSFILTSLLASFGASGALAFFPLGGAEFGILGVFLLTTSIFLICKNIPSAAVCVEKN